MKFFLTTKLASYRLDDLPDDLIELWCQLYQFLTNQFCGIRVGPETRAAVSKIYERYGIPDSVTVRTTRSQGDPATLYPRQWNFSPSHAKQAVTDFENYISDYRQEEQPTDESDLTERPPGPFLPGQRTASRNTANGETMATPVAMTSEQLTALVAAAVSAALASQPARTDTTTGAGKDFRPRDLGYFDPNPDAEAVETKDNKTIYHNVFSFTNRLRVKTTTENAAYYRQNLDACLQGKADRWYTEELGNLARSGLRNDPDGVEAWCQALESRFREAPGKALSRLEAIRYTTKDAKNKKDPEEYVQQIVLNGRNAGTATTEYAQVLTAYEHMDAELRISIPVPNETTTVASFIKYLSVQKNNRFDLYGKTMMEPRSGYGARGGYSNRSRFNNFQSFSSNVSPRSYGYPTGNTSPYLQNAARERGYERNPRGRQSFQSNQRDSTWSNNKPQDAAKPAFKQEFAKGKQVDKPSENRPRFNRDQRDTRGRMPAKPMQRAYLGEASGNPQGQDDYQAAYQSYQDDYYNGYEYQAQEDDDMGENEEGYYLEGPCQEEEDENTVEAHFTANPVPEKPACRRCNRTFDSNNKMHYYLRSGCEPKKPKRKSAVGITTELRSFSQLRKNQLRHRDTALGVGSMLQQKLGWDHWMQPKQQYAWILVVE